MTSYSGVHICRAIAAVTVMPHHFEHSPSMTAMHPFQHLQICLAHLVLHHMILYTPHVEHGMHVMHAIVASKHVS